jgi:DNA polymerase family A
VSDGIKIVSVPFDAGKVPLRGVLSRYPRASIVGHNFLASDLPVLDSAGIRIDPNRVEDTIVRYWLTHAHLCKTTQKDADGESTRRGAGFMNLWTMLSLTTSLPNYKLCHESACDGAYCPEHDEYGYNGIDAWGPVMALPKLIQLSQLLGVDKLYPMHRQLSLVLYEMRQTGVLINTPYVDKLRANWEKVKDVLYNKVTKVGILPFNPDSPDQVKAYFAEQKVVINGKKRAISLKNSKEETIKNAIERLGLSEIDEDSIDKLEPAFQALFALRDWKAQGDGPDRWFAPRYWDEKADDWEGYVDPDGYVHPRLGFYTSTARMMCTSPNMQNVPARRKDPITGEKMKKMVRRAIIAPPGYYLIKSDFSNAENRTFLHLAGYTDIPLRNPDGSRYDLHSWVAQMAGIHDDDPIAQALGGAREAAKSVQHACLTGDHEVLTPIGWRSIDKYSGEPIALWEDGRLSFEVPDKFLQFDVNEEISEIGGTALRTAVTNNHEFPVFIDGSWNGKKYHKMQRVRADSLKSGRIPISGVLEDSVETVTDSEIVHAIAVQADGSIHYDTNRAHFHVVKPKKIERLRQLFGVSGKPCKCHPNGYRFDVIFKTRLLTGKSFNANLLLLSQRQRELFLEEILFWDGHKRNDGSNTKIYDNSDLTSVLWAQTVAHLSGREALVRENGFSGFPCEKPKQMWRLRFNSRKYAWVPDLVREQRHFIGPVYCFKTRTGFFLVRYKNTIHITGNSNYLEGLDLLWPSELRDATIRAEIAAGARLVYPNWKFQEKVVTFTGVNLARRMFGSATWENRRKALQISQAYFGRFSKVRGLQQSITHQAETENMVRPPNGYVLRSYGYPAERMKTACATWGSQPVAHFTKLTLLNLWQVREKVRPILQIHDEVLCIVPLRIQPAYAKKLFLEAMEIEVAEIPGLRLPVDVESGLNWGDTKEI